MNPMDLKRGIDKVVDAIVAELKKKARKVSNNDEIAQVGWHDLGQWRMQR